MTYRNWIFCSLHTCRPNVVTGLYEVLALFPSIDVTFKSKWKRRRGAVGIARLTCDRCSIEQDKTLYSNCLVLVGSRNEFERDLHKQKITCFTIELK